MTKSFFKNQGIRQCYVSPSLGPFKNEFIKRFDLENYKLANIPTLFFGMYTREDFMVLKRHTGDSYIIFEGHDIELLKQSGQLNYIKNISNLKGIFSVTKAIEKKLNNLNINNKYVELEFVDKDIFVFQGNTDKKKIYVYNGFSKENEKLFGKNIYDNIINKLDKYEIIFSNTLNVMYSDLPNIYNQCFIGLCMIDDENPIREMISMGIPVINNTEEGCIRWNFIDDVLDTINKIKNGNNIENDPITVKSINESIQTESTIQSITDEDIKLNDQQNNIDDTIIETTNKITEDVLNDITQKIISEVIAKVSNKINKMNYKTFLFEQIDLELKKLNLLNF
jgi:predicted RNA-binding protein Jag